MHVRNQVKGSVINKALALISVSVVVLSIALAQTVQALETKTIAIIDTAVDSSKLSNVIHEVCFTHNKTCQNKEAYHEGPGAAMINDWKIKGAVHGFNMAKIATITDPSVKIVFIRIADEKVYDTFSIIRNDGGSLSRAIEWVSNNALRFNISAVSISQSRSNFNVGSCPRSAIFESSVVKLKQNSIPTFVATGNDAKKNQIGFPACVPGVYPVAAIAPDRTITRYSNIDSQTKILANGCFRYRGNICEEFSDYFGVSRAVSGTSVATIVAATLVVSQGQSKTLDGFLLTLPKTEVYPYLVN